MQPSVISPSTPKGVIRFGIYEADRSVGELRKGGVRVRLAAQPFRVLMALLDRPGELVGRDELRRLLWADAEAGNFEQGITRAVNKLRVALCDSASNPRLIETLPGLGYRFIGSVEQPNLAVVDTSPAPPPPAPNRKWLLAAGGAIATIVLAALLFRTLVPERLPDARWRKLTTDNFSKTAPAVSDGSRLFFLANYGGEAFLAQIPIRGGQPTRLPITLPGPLANLQDISPDGQDLLLLAGTTMDRSRVLPLWTLQIADGSARRLGAVLASSASYAPSDGTVAYTTESELWILAPNGARRRLVELKDSVLGSVCWDPAGNIVRFSRKSPSSSQSAAWQIRRDGSALEQVMPQWQATSHVPAGWTTDGRLELFAAEGSLWFRRSDAWWPDPVPSRATDGELEFSDRIRIRADASLVAVGIDRLGELQQFDMASKEWRPLLDGISAEAAEYSRDGKRVAYITYPQRTLWVRDADGKRPIQITSAPMSVTSAHWSPDGKRIAFTAYEAQGKPSKIYLADTNGGPVRLAAPKDKGSQDDATWSADGKSLLYGINIQTSREPAYIRSVQIESGAITRLAGSDNLFSPRLSPDGRMVAALEFSGERRLMVRRLDDNASGWTSLSTQHAGWPTWSADSKSILYRVADRLILTGIAGERRSEEIAIVKSEELGGFSRGNGRAADGSPTRTLNRDSRQIYEVSFR